jgi:3',5'-cyclic AMP phosphodiesterase CpdA
MKSILPLFLLLLLSLIAQPCSAETLYQRSLKQFDANARIVKPADYSFVVMGDSRDGEEIFRKALKLAKSYHPLFILHGGDYSHRGGKQETDRFLELLQENVPGIPYFVVMGNHEDRTIFPERVGPFDFTLHSKRLGLTVIAVDDSQNALNPAEIGYLKNGLAAGGRSTFVAMHVPPKTDKWDWHTFTEGADQLQELLGKSKVQGVFFSHVHLFAKGKYGGVPAFITGGAGAPLYDKGFPGDPVYHIMVVRVKNGLATYTMVPIGK